ncbi:energy-coupling factor transporter transmembrane component T [Saccharibacillus sp. CPCC 101409]|uniref:energy-coupling factor transporter transmembrane component T family protein n=1 Tax=Saccharibacillus sp. CPCC 101409 TaxID=3058041 RepID=UPI002673DBEB|nr:energy-coupling factor transporter transmembrane component T [Saccharibacillus sp. CPCC 101409]MDO3412376.1 energy-coupling factor transporter transmembrane component T [Saccharibacillus sp. CPCC 101409]
MNGRSRLTIGKYIDRDSALHGLDPRIKLLGLLALMIVFLLLRSWTGYAASSAAVAGILLLSRIPLRSYLRGLLPVLPILIFTLLYHLALGRGEQVVAEYGFVRITREGAWEGTAIVWRILLMILPASALTASTRPLTLARGLERLLSPLSKLRVPIPQFSLMIVIAIRFIPTILGELDRILVARRARGFDYAGRNPVKRLTGFIPVLVPLLATTVQRADNLTLAIEARAYGDGRGRTVYRPLRFGKKDAAAAIWIAGIAALILLADRSGTVHALAVFLRLQ